MNHAAHRRDQKRWSDGYRPRDEHSHPSLNVEVEETLEDKNRHRRQAHMLDKLGVGEGNRRGEEGADKGGREKE